MRNSIVLLNNLGDETIVKVYNLTSNIQRDEASKKILSFLSSAIPYSVFEELRYRMIKDMTLEEIIRILQR